MVFCSSSNDSKVPTKICLTFLAIENHSKSIRNLHRASFFFEKTWLNMAQQTEQQLQDELLSILRSDGKGWDIGLFEDKIKITTCLCHHCGSVCDKAVELGCDHEDNDIFIHCNNCLSDLIQDNDGKCPINKHENPIIAPSRAIRRQISKSTVICPYSTQYAQQQKLGKNIRNLPQQIMDTIECNDDEGKEEGMVVNNKKIGCEWKGTLNDLLTKDHLNQCMMKYNPSFAKDLFIKKLQQEVKDKNQQIQYQIKVSSELKLKLDLTIEKNRKLEDENKKQAMKLANFTQEIDEKNEQIAILQHQINNLYIEKTPKQDVQQNDEEKQKIKNEMNVHCTCGAILVYMEVKRLYFWGKAWCDICGSWVSGKIFHCPKNRTMTHPKGWDVCLSCAQKELAKQTDTDKDIQFGADDIVTSATTNDNDQ